MTQRRSGIVLDFQTWDAGGRYRSQFRIPRIHSNLEQRVKTSCMQSPSRPTPRYVGRGEGTKGRAVGITGAPRASRRYGRRGARRRAAPRCPAGRDLGRERRPGGATVGCGHPGQAGRLGGLHAASTHEGKQRCKDDRFVDNLYIL